MKFVTQAADMASEYAQMLVGSGTPLLVFAVLLIIIGVLLDLLVLRTIRDHRVMDQPPINAATILLGLFSALCSIWGLLILFKLFV